MFKVFFINFGYYTDRTFNTVEEALAYCKDTSFETRISTRDGDIIGTYSPISGFKRR